MVSNFYPIRFDFESFQVQRVLYDANLLKDLSTKYSSCSFFRNENWIYICPFNDEEIISSEVVTLDLIANYSVTGSLIRQIISYEFINQYQSVDVTSQIPLRFYSRNPKHDYIQSLLPESLKDIISFKRQTEVQIRCINVNEVSTWGLVLNNEYKWRFKISCFDLKQEGFSLEKMEVLLLQKHEAVGKSFEYFHFIGIIESVSSQAAIVLTNLGKREYLLKDLYIYKSKQNLTSYLEFKIGPFKTQNIFNEIAKKDIQRYNSKSLHEELNQIARSLGTIKYQNYDGFSFSVDQKAIDFQNTFTQQKCTFLFSYDGYKRKDQTDTGLTEYGPYDSLTFEVKRPKVLALCHRNNRGTFTTFLAKLKNGIPNSKYFRTGMVKKYSLQDIDFQIIEIENYSISSYIDSLQRWIRLNSDVNYDLAIIETKKEWKSFSPSNNPYYHVKSYLLSLGIPVQLLANENAKKTDQYLDAILNSITLQIYAKMGGTPWALPTNTNIDREIIVGIGSSSFRANSFANSDSKRIVGITTFFTSDGSYLFGNKSRDVSYDQYFQELLLNLKTSISELSKRDGWKNGDTIRIVFHVFKTIKNIEIEVVQNLVSMYSQYEIKFAFVTISADHPYLIFDTSQPGVQAAGGQKGQFLPARGISIMLNDNNCLVQMKGPQQIKTVKQGVSRPILISLHGRSTFKDLVYITQQIFNFTNLSWRSFLPAQLPATLYYSDLIAEVLGNLREINGWRSEVINGPLKFKKWFL